MAPGFHIKVDARDVQRALRHLSDRDAPFVTSYALNKTAQDIRAEEVRTMSSVFDRPTRFTLNALFVRPSSKRDLTAFVEFKDGFNSVPAWRYLGPQVMGGGRAKKSHERALQREGILRADEYCVPAQGAKLDAHGNIPGPHLTRMLSQLGAAEHSAGYMANMTQRSRKRNIRSAGGRYFVVRPGVNGQRKDATPGVYIRTSARTIQPYLIFVRAPQYTKRFPFYEVAQRVFDQRFEQRAREGFERFVLSRLKRAA